MATLRREAITLDPRCQPRMANDPELIEEYTAAMREGVVFPPLTVYRDADGTHWLADGFHRHAAAGEAGRDDIDCDIREGTMRDAILHAVGANADHGKRRTNRDKRRAVETLLQDPEWSQWSDSEIARRCAVHHTFVGKLRSSLVTNTSDTPTERTYTDRYGNQRTMDTSRIGRTKLPAPAPPDESVIGPRTATADLDTEDQFVCGECGELFSVPVWHCEYCDHHWSDGDEQCKNCYRSRDGSDIDDLPEAEEVDPNDPASFLAPLPSSPRPIQPAPKLTRQRVGLAAVADRLATQLIREHGVANTLEILDHLYEIVNERAAG